MPPPLRSPERVSPPGPRAAATVPAQVGNQALPATFWDLSDELMVLVDTRGRVRATHGAWRRVLGVDPDGPATSITSLLGDLVHPDDRAGTARWLRRLVRHDTFTDVEVRLRAGARGYRWFSWSGTRRADLWHAVCRDTTDVHAAEAWSADLARFWQSALDSITGRVAVLDEHGTIIAVNASWRRFGRDSGNDADSVGTSYLGVCDAAAPDPLAGRAAAGLRSLLSGEVDSVTLDYPLGDRWFTLSATKFAAEGPTRVVVCHVDITEQMESQRRVAQAHDHLSAVTDSMAEGLFALDGQGRVTMMNQAAEQLLGWSLADVGGQPLHEIIHHRYPDGRPFPAESCPLQRVHRHGETLRLVADVFVRRDGHHLPVTFTAAPLEAEDGLHGCVVVFIDATEVHAEQQRLAEEVYELAWLHRVRQALDEDRLELFAQPILHLGSGAVTQHELLLRVRNADGSVEPPAEYLRCAEEYGLVGEIDRWVIQRGLELAAAGMHVELNISATSVGDEQLLGEIERWVRASGADPHLVVFEITETTLLRDERAGRVFVERLDELGCKVALDDFGTGYGGFTYLKQLPVHYLKIDIEFVRDLRDNQASRHVVQAVVNLARGFGVATVAEGVEDEQTLRLLRELGVDFAQGYHIGRPAPLG